MAKLDIKAKDPMPEEQGSQPSLLIRYSCTYPGCGKVVETEQKKPGYLPRYCEEHKEVAKREATKRRVEAWRKAHPEDARQAQRDYRNNRK